MTDMKTPQTVNLSNAEMALYSSGMSRGHAEAMKDAASELRRAIGIYREMLENPKADAEFKKQVLPWLDTFESIAKQIHGKIDACKKTANDRLKVFEQRPKAEPIQGQTVGFDQGLGLRQRILNAMIGFARD